VTVIDQLRAFAGDLPEAYEGFPGGELVVRVNKKVFVFLGSELDPAEGKADRRPGISVKLAESHDEALAVTGDDDVGAGAVRAHDRDRRLHGETTTGAGSAMLAGSARVLASRSENVRGGPRLVP